MSEWAYSLALLIATGVATNNLDLVPRCGSNWSAGPRFLRRDCPIDLHDPGAVWKLIKYSTIKEPLKNTSWPDYLAQKRKDAEWVTAPLGSIEDALGQLRVLINAGFIPNRNGKPAKVTFVDVVEAPGEDTQCPSLTGDGFSAIDLPNEGLPAPRAAAGPPAAGAGVSTHRNWNPGEIGETTVIAGTRTRVPQGRPPPGDVTVEGYPSTSRRREVGDITTMVELGRPQVRDPASALMEDEELGDVSVEDKPERSNVPES